MTAAPSPRCPIPRERVLPGHANDRYVSIPFCGGRVACTAAESSWLLATGLLTNRLQYPLETRWGRLTVPTRRTLSALLRVKTLSGRTRVRQGTILVHVCQDAHVCQRKGFGRDWQAWRRRARVCQWVPHRIPWHTCAVWHTWGGRNARDGCWPPMAGRGAGDLRPSSRTNP